MIVHNLRDAGLSWYARLPTRPAEVAADRPTALLIRPDHIGDVLFLGPGLERLHEALPDARVVLAVGPWSRAVAEHLPGVDEILTIPFPSFDRDPGRLPWDPYVELLRCAGKLRALGSWLAVILRDDDWWSALAAERAGIDQRVGSGNPIVEPYLSDRLDLQRQHWVERDAELIDASIAMLGGTSPAAPVTPDSAPLRWRLDDQDREAAAALLATAEIDGEFIGIAPGSGAPVKLWPVDRWVAVGRLLFDAYRVPIVVAGSTAEAAMVDQIAGGIGSGAVSIAGRTTLPVLAGVFQRARLVLGPDSGPLHLAVAVATPTIHLFGPSSVEQFGPWGDPRTHRVVEKPMHCRECGNLDLKRSVGAGCMLAIAIDDVVETANELLSGG